MNPVEQGPGSDAFLASGPGLRQGEVVTLLFTDLVGSTALKQSLGDRAGVAAVQEHHSLVRQLLKRFPQAEEISTSGDSFFLAFLRPSDAVQFALRLQSALRKFNEGRNTPLQDRVGMHLGEVVVEATAPGKRDLHGLSVDLCARVMSLAQAGQNLMTRPVFDNARQSLKGEELEGAGPLSWFNHGRYELKGVEEPVEICEVRAGDSPMLSPPKVTEKARRVESPGEEAVLGWRPAVRQVVPNTQWVLEQKLGEGGFGEVWLGRHQKLKDRRVFKFCFRADQVRSLKREMTLFRVLKERIGEHPNIVRLLEVYFEDPPFYVEEEYVSAQDLVAWCAAQGGVDKVPEETRLEIVAQIADALQAAHDAGVIHRDVKPGNILVASEGGRSPGREPHAAGRHPLPVARGPGWTAVVPPPAPPQVQAKLTDFGIGQVVSEEALKDVTRAGFTQTLVADSSSSRTGTQLYMAPELLAGRPASTRSDIYSLGVVLFQLLVGDFRRPVTTDWAKSLSDELLEDDLRHCFAGDPEERFVGAGQLAQRLRSLPERRSQRDRRAAEQLALEKSAYRRGMVRVAGVAALIVAVVAGLAMAALVQSRRASTAAAAERRERRAAERHLYAASMNLAQQAWEENNVQRVRQLLDETEAHPDRGFEWHYWQRQIHLNQRAFPGGGGVAFSPDGQRIVSGLDRTGRVVATATGAELVSLQGHGAGITRVDFSQDGRRIVTISTDNTARIWDAGTGNSLFTLEGHSAFIRSVAFSPDSRRVVTAGEDRMALVWDVTTGRKLVGVTNNSIVYCVTFSPDGQRIVTGCWDGTARFWDAVSGREVRSPIVHAGPVGMSGIPGVAYYPDGRRIVTCGLDGTARLWEVDAGRQLLVRHCHEDWITSAAISPDGQYIVTTSKDRTAKVWDADDWTERWTLKGHRLGVSSAAFARGGRWVATTGLDGTIRLWDLSAAGDRLPLKARGIAVTAAAFHPDGQWLVTGGFDQTTRVWDLATGKELLTLQGHRGGVLAVACSSDGGRIATAGRDETARVYDLGTGRELVVFRGHRGPLTAIAFSPDNHRMVTCGEDGTARLWEVATGRALVVFRDGHQGGLTSVAFSPDGRRLLTGSKDQTAVVWDAGTGRPLLTLQGHGLPVHSVAFSPDGGRVVTGGDDGTAKLWETTRGTVQLTFRGHTKTVSSVAFSPDGQRVLSAGGDGTAKLWDVADGQELLSLQGGGLGVSFAGFSRDGRRIATVGRNQSVRVWEMASAQQIATWKQEEQALIDAETARQRERAKAATPDRPGGAQDPGAIRRWLVLAPLPLKGGGAKSAWDMEQVPREAQIKPRAGDKFRIGEAEPGWTAVDLEYYELDFDRLLGMQMEMSVAYAVCYLHSEHDLQDLVMKVSSGDQAKVFLNGKEIYRHEGVRGWYPDQDAVPGVSLRAGANLLVFKIANVLGGWGGSIRFTDAQGKPARGIKVLLDPDAKE